MFFEFLARAYNEFLEGNDEDNDEELMMMFGMIYQLFFHASISISNW